METAPWIANLRRKRKENMALFKKLEASYNKIKGVRVGDYVIGKNGKITRITYIWRWDGEPQQWQAGGNGGSYYLGNGYVSYSGSLSHGFDEGTKFKNTGRKKIGNVWIWDKGFAGAGRGIDFPMKFRVFKASTNEKD